MQCGCHTDSKNLVRTEPYGMWQRRLVARVPSGNRVQFFPGFTTPGFPSKREPNRGLECSGMAYAFLPEMVKNRQVFGRPAAARGFGKNVCTLGKSDEMQEFICIRMGSR